MLLQAQYHFDHGALDDAEAAADEALRLLPGDPQSCRLLGLVAAAKQEFPRARSLLLPLGDACRDDAMVQTAIAETLWAMEGPQAAIAGLRHVLTIDPARHRVRGRLGVALLQSAQPAAARDELIQALAGRPGDVGLYLHLGLALRELGDTGGAIETLRDAVRTAPEIAPLHAALGEALLDAGDAPAAMSALAEAAKRDPNSHLTWMLLGRAAILAGQGERSIPCYNQALKTIPSGADPADQIPARTALANALHLHGRVAEARIEFQRVMQASLHRRQRGTVRQARVGVLAAPGSANTPTEFIIDRTIFRVDPIFVVDGLDHHDLHLPDRFDVLFNAISDPDEAAAPLHQADEISRDFARRVINPPSAIWPTTRDAMARRLADLAGALVPATQRYHRDAILAGAIGEVRYPVLLRPLGSHGGSGMLRLENAAALRAAVEANVAEMFYLTAYCDCQSADGLWRKFRMIFVGGVAFPYHLSIGHDWLNHYFRTETNRHDALRAEEARFLQDPNAALGPVAIDALAGIAARVDLDYFGVDFALHADGRLIVFECNAAMRVRDSRERGSAKATAAVRIRNAMSQLLAPS